MTDRDERGRLLKGCNPPGVRFGRRGEEGQVNQGKHSNYDEEAVSGVLDSVAEGMSIYAACRKHGVKLGTFASWAHRDYRGLRDRFNAALQCKYMLEVDRTVEMSDSVLGCQSTAEVFAIKNACDSRRWIAGRIIRAFHPEAHLQVDHHKTEITITLPGKETDEAYLERVRRQKSAERGLIDLPGKLIEDRSGDAEDEGDE